MKLLYTLHIILWTAAWSAAPAARAEQALQIDLAPAWNGYYQPGKATEIDVSLLARQGGSVELSVGNIKQTVRLKPDTPSIQWFPLRPEQAKQTVLAYRTDRQTPAARKEIVFTETRKPNLALAIEGLAVEARQTLAEQAQQADQHHFFSVSASSLPRFFPAYQSIDVLIIDHAGLKNLEAAQIQALSGYLAQCGKLIAVEIPDAVYDSLNKIAGCRGNYLAEISSPYRFTGQTQALINRPPATSPDLTTLSAIEPNEADGPGSALLAFCFGYLLICLIIALIGKQKYPLLMLPLCAGMIALLIWYQQKPSAYLLSWLEMDHRQTTARYAALLTMQSAGKWNGNIDLPIATVFSKQTHHAMPLHYHHENPQLMTVDAEFALLSKSEWRWESSIQIDAPLGLKMVDSRPFVDNGGKSPSPAGLLRWDDKIYPLPALQPGQSWSPTGAATITASDSALVKRLSERHEQAAALLIPFTPELLTFPVNHRGWLLIASDRFLP